MCRKLYLPLIALCLLFTASAPALTEEPASNDQGKLAASCQRCGDGYCAPSCENERTCPADCRQTKRLTPAPERTPAPTAPARCGKCGDGQCVASCGETAESCPRDCGVPSEQKASAENCEPKKN
jgi:hypothetical protein